MYIEEKKLLELLGLAFDEGHYGYGDLKDSVIRKIFDDFAIQVGTTSPTIENYSGTIEPFRGVSGDSGTFAVSEDRLNFSNSVNIPIQDTLVESPAEVGYMTGTEYMTMDTSGFHLIQ